MCVKWDRENEHVTLDRNYNTITTKYELNDKLLT